MRVLIAAGSSGGHIFPAIATADRLRELDGHSEIFFIGGKREIDRDIFANEGYRYRALSPRGGILRDLALSFSILRKFRPDVAVGFGGYVSFPALVAAKMMGVPTVSHEQNIFPGLANRVLANLVDRVAVSFNETGRFFQRRSIVRETGNPLRRGLFRSGREEALERFGLSPGRFVILAMGGSQGAHFVNEAVVEAIKAMDGPRCGRIGIIHLCGAKDLEAVKAAYAAMAVENRVFSFLDMMGPAYSACDLVISRAGATSMAEIIFFGRPAVLIPYPDPRVHQLENARFLEKNGAAVVIEQGAAAGKGLHGPLTGLMDNKDGLLEMAANAARLSKPDAADKLAAEVLNAAKR